MQIYLMDWVKFKIYSLNTLNSNNSSDTNCILKQDSKQTNKPSVADDELSGVRLKLSRVCVSHRKSSCIHHQLQFLQTHKFMEKRL